MKSYSKFIYTFVLGVSVNCHLMAAPERTGEEVFSQHCAMCHAVGIENPGTMRLEKLLGPENAVLQQRDDLHIDYIKMVVRTGLAEMPPLRPTEITDIELEALAAYLSKTEAED